MSRREIKRFERPDGKRSLTIFERDDGCYAFVEDGEQYEGYVKEYYWAPIHFSGIYGTAEEAERDARLMTPWLRENSN
jgi:hypothetical protein